MKKARLHCSHVSHFCTCTCTHPRYLHGALENIGPEDGRCSMRKCRCEQFEPLPGYREEQLKHEEVPIEGYQQRTKAGDFIL